MTKQEFIKKTGDKPIHDDLERVNCDTVGESGHYQCGWCKKHDMPRFKCGCIINNRDL